MVKYARAAILEKINEPLVVKTVKIPELKTGQVLIKVHYSGVCRSQLMEVQGSRGEDRWLPHLLGHEGSGIVVSTGPNVKKVSEGDEVIIGWIKGKGINASGAIYSCCNKKINSGAVTTFSNYTIASENRVVKKPKWVPFDEAVLFGCALPTGGGMALNNFKKNHKFVSIIGLGGIGFSALITLKELGAKKIIAIDPIEKKRKLAVEYGADFALNPNDSNFRKHYDYIFPNGSDLCIEAGGSIKSIELGFSILHPSHGHLVFASHPPDNLKISLFPHELISGKKITGSWGGGVNLDKDINALSKIFYKKDSILYKLITKKYKLEEINEALNELSCGKVFRPIIKMEH